MTMPSLQKLVLTRSDLGDGGWSLHPPGTTDDQIMTGDVMPLLTGDNSSGPTDADYADAWRMLNPFEIGHWVCGGDPATQDFDSGRVVDVSGKLVTVAWTSGVRTTQNYWLLDKG